MYTALWESPQERLAFWKWTHQTRRMVYSLSSPKCSFYMVCYKCPKISSSYCPYYATKLVLNCDNDSCSRYTGHAFDGSDIPNLDGIHDFDDTEERPSEKQPSRSVPGSHLPDSFIGGLIREPILGEVISTARNCTYLTCSPASARFRIPAHRHSGAVSNTRNWSGRRVHFYPRLPPHQREVTFLEKIFADLVLLSSTISPHKSWLQALGARANSRDPRRCWSLHLHHLAHQPAFVRNRRVHQHSCHIRSFFSSLTKQ